MTPHVQQTTTMGWKLKVVKIYQWTKGDNLICREQIKFMYYAKS